MKKARPPVGPLSRRRFLVGAGAAGLGGGALWSGLGVRRAAGEPARAWGEYPAELAHARLPEGRRAKNVLEVLIRGGLCPWETFYAVDDPAYGGDRGEMWFTYQDGPDGVPAWYDKCYGGTGAGPLLEPFETDLLGTQVNLGPFIEPLRRRADILSRLRMHVLTHDAFPHEAAFPIALTGHSAFSPRMASMGAHVSRYFLEHGGPAHGSPLAYTLYYQNEARTASAWAAGRHPGLARPFPIESKGWGQSAEAFERLAVDATTNPTAGVYDALMRRFAARLELPGGERLRSPAMSGMEFAADQARQLLGMEFLLPRDYFAAGPGANCRDVYDEDMSLPQLKVAARLLRHPGSDARHVTILDIGHNTDNPGYDFHDLYVPQAAQMYPYFFQRLVDIINEPGEDHPEKINLDETLVVLNTEFGRSPGIENFTGRNHHPLAYVTMMFGGPIGPEQRGIVGAIDSRALPVEPLLPAETRAATLVALGIYPFSAESYASSDVNGVDNAEDAALKLRDVVLGVSG